MKLNKYTAVLIAAVAVIAAVTILVHSRTWVSKQVYMRSGKHLIAQLTPAQQKKYANDLQYTLAKFWQFYERGIVSRDDLNDVMDKMKELRERKELKDMEIFDFVGYVSRLYTDAMNRHQREMLPE